MIKEYQIKDDEGNILGGSGSGSSEIDIIEASLNLGYGCGGYNFQASTSNYQVYGFVSTFQNDLYYKVSIPGAGIFYYNIFDHVAEETIRRADGTLLYLRTQAYTGYAYTPVPYRIKIVG